jgi:hypothetical protein
MGDFSNPFACVSVSNLFTKSSGFVRTYMNLNALTLSNYFFALAIK